MKRKGIPKKRIGPITGCMERSIRMRRFKGETLTLNAAERSAYGGISVSLCGIGSNIVSNSQYLRLAECAKAFCKVTEKKEKNNEKEVMRRPEKRIDVEVIHYPVNSGTKLKEALR